MEHVHLPPNSTVSLKEMPLLALYRARYWAEVNKMTPLESKSSCGLNQCIQYRYYCLTMKICSYNLGIRVLECLLPKHGALSSNLGIHRKSSV